MEEPEEAVPVAAAEARARHSELRARAAVEGQAAAWHRVETAKGRPLKLPQDEGGLRPSHGFPHERQGQGKDGAREERGALEVQNYFPFVFVILNLYI